MGREWMRRYEHLCPFFPPGKSTFSRKWPMSLLLIDIVMRSRCVYRSLWLIPPERNGAYSFPAHPYSWIFFPFCLFCTDALLLVEMMLPLKIPGTGKCWFLASYFHDVSSNFICWISSGSISWLPIGGRERASELDTPDLFFLSFIYLRNSICSNYSILN